MLVRSMQNPVCRHSSLHGHDVHQRLSAVECGNSLQPPPGTLPPRISHVVLRQHSVAVTDHSGNVARQLIRAPGLGGWLHKVAIKSVQAHMASEKIRVRRGSAEGRRAP